jgi:phage shock protein PspC (stress-responsive transcriptional regulator)
MTNPYPPYNQPPRKLERSRSNRVLGGVCGGVANYVNMDPTLVRVLTVVISLFTGVPIILYLIALFVIPEEDTNGGPRNYPPVQGPQQQQQWNYGPGVDSTQGQAPYQPSYAPGQSPYNNPNPSYGNTAGSAEDPAVWGPEGAPWEATSDSPSGSSAAPTGQPGAAPEQTSSWESTPADPDKPTGDDRR